MHAAEEMAPFLIARRLLHERRIVDGDVQVTDCSRRNRNFKIAVAGGDGFLVKQAMEARTRRWVAQEAAAYRFLYSAPDLASFTRYLPRFYEFDDRAGILVLGLLENSSTVTEHRRRRGRVSARVAGAMGNAVGQLHRFTRLSQGHGTPGWTFGRATEFLTFHRPNLAAFVGLSRASAQLIATIQESEVFCAQLDALRAAWREDSLIHGDLRWDNWHVLEMRNGGGPDLKIVDWEMAGTGDPCWDVGCILCEYLLAWLRSAPIATDVDPDHFMCLSTFPLSTMQPAIRRFWQSYVRVMELDAPTAGEWLVRSTRFAAARLVQAAFEDAQHATELSDPTIYLLQLSTNMLARPVDAAARLYGLIVAEQ